MIKKIFILLFIVLFSSEGKAIQLSDSARISLLTNAPWNGAVYAVFGHTAIRVADEPNNMDFVFNYGVFDFDSPDFIYRFVKGETDYILAVQDFNRYLMEYSMRGVDTYEQVLNITYEEKQALWETLFTNALPENREYRYNFLFDNCSTRPRDRIEDAVNGKIKYQETNKQQTFRDLLHECIGSYPWLRFGIDLVIGSDADRLATDREKMFLPIYLKNALDDAIIVSSDGAERNLVSEKNLLTENSADTYSLKVHDYPMLAGYIFLFITLIVSVLSFRKLTVIPKIYDVMLFLIAGLAGCVITFLVFFSEHPAVGSNWNMVWLNPLQLIIAFLIPIKKMAKAVYYYHFINFALLSLFLLCWAFIPQQLQSAFIPYILCIWMRSGTNFVVYRRNRKKLTPNK